MKNEAILPSKPIQIVGYPSLHVLCEDGSIWKFVEHEGVWQCLYTHPIPE